MYADRALFLARERANQAVYFQEHNIEFRDRVLGLGVSDVLRYREELDPAYRRLTEDRVRELAARFKVTHFVPARRRLQLPDRLPAGRLDRVPGLALTLLSLHSRTCTCHPRVSRRLPLTGAERGRG